MSLHNRSRLHVAQPNSTLTSMDMLSYKQTVIVWTSVLLGFGLLFGSPSSAWAQMERERAQETRRVTDVFWAQNIVEMSTVRPLPAGNLNVTIMHTFGLVSDGYQQFFGLDTQANIRLGIDYGVTDWLSLGIGRTRTDKVVDGRAKLHLLHQTQSGSTPVDVALKGDVGITTQQNGFDFSERLSFLSSVLIARSFGGHASLQLTPMIAHFNTVPQASDPNTVFALGIGGQLPLSRRFALTAEFIPVFGDRIGGTTNASSIGLDIQTGGHVFQLFFTTSFWPLEQYTVARNQDQMLDGDFRFGFNVNRVFGVGNPD